MRKLWPVWLCLALWVSPTAAQELKFEISVDKNQVEMGGQLTLTMTMAGPNQNLPTPRVNAVPNFTVAGQSSSQNVSITNGQVQASRQVIIVLLPQREGSFTVGPFQLQISGQTYTSNALRVKVVKAGAAPTPAAGGSGQGDVFIDVIPDRREVYLHEQVTVTYYLYFKVNVTGLDYTQQPTTTGFWMEELDVPKDQAGNFTIEQKVLNGVRYNRVTVRRMALFPSSIGELEVGPIKLTTKVRASSGDPFDAFFSFGRMVDKPVNGPAIVIKVKDLPAGSPAGFSGAVGQYDVKMKVDKTTLPANDAVTMTISVSGTGTIQAISNPPVNFPTDFKVYDPKITEKSDKSTGVIKGTKTFEYVLIPRFEGQYTIDPINFSFFDPKQGVYRTVSTDPIKITTTKSIGGDSESPLVFGGGKEDIKLVNRDIRFIKHITGSIRNEGQPLHRHPLYFAGFVGSIAIFGVVLIYRKRRDRLETDLGYARKLQASRQAKKLFNQANKAFKAKQSQEFYGAVAHALTTYMADKWNLPPAAVTADTAQEILTERAVTTETAQKVVSCLNTCNFARFAPSATEGQERMTAVLKEAENCIGQLEKHR